MFIVHLSPCKTLHLFLVLRGETAFLEIMYRCRSPRNSGIMKTYLATCLESLYSESCVGEVGRRRSGVGMPIVCMCVVCVCVLCISVPEAPWERPHAQLWALLPLSAGAWVLAACCPITWWWLGLRRARCPRSSQDPGGFEAQHLVSTHCSSLGSRSQMSFHLLLVPPFTPRIPSAQRLNG